MASFCPGWLSHFSILVIALCVALPVILAPARASGQENMPGLEVGGVTRTAKLPLTR
jgi:hypothetical protein